MPSSSRVPDASIRTLVAAAKNGDESAYEALFAGAMDRLQLFLRVRLGAKLRAVEESLDLLQETYLAAHRDFASFEPADNLPADDAFRGWLCAIAENCIRARADHHGAKKRDGGAPQGLTRVCDGLAAGTLGPATRVERLDERQRLRTALLELEATDRELLTARHFEGLSFRAIAARLDRSETAVRRSFARAMAQLGQHLPEEQS